MEAATKMKTDQNNPTISGGDEIMNSQRLIDFLTRKPDLANTLTPLIVLALCGANLETIQKIHAIKPSAFTVDLFVHLCEEGVGEEILDFLAKHFKEHACTLEDGRITFWNENGNTYKLDTQNRSAVQKILSFTSLTWATVCFDKLHSADEVEIISTIFDNKSVEHLNLVFPEGTKQMNHDLARWLEKGHCHVESLVVRQCFCSNLELFDNLFNNLQNLKNFSLSTDILCVKSVSLLSQLMALNKLERFSLNYIPRSGRRRRSDNWPSLTPLFSPLRKDKKLQRLALMSLGKQAFEECKQQLAQILKHDNTTITEVIFKGRVSELFTDSQCLLIRRCSGQDSDPLHGFDLPQFSFYATANRHGRGNARDPTRPLVELVNNLISVNNDNLIPNYERVGLLYELLRQLPSKWSGHSSARVAAALAAAATKTDTAQGSPAGTTISSSTTTTTPTATTSHPKRGRKRTASRPRMRTRNKRQAIGPRRSTRNTSQAIGPRRSTRNKRPANGPPF